MGETIESTNAGAGREGTVTRPVKRPEAVRRYRRTTCLLLALLLPLIAVVVPLLHGIGNVWPRLAATGPQPPPLVRQRLERALNDENDERNGPPIVWLESASHNGRSRLWFADRRDRNGKNVRAVCDETTGEILSFSRDKDLLDRDVDGQAVRDTDAAKSLARRFLYRLCKPDPPSWKLTVEPATTPPYPAGYGIWFLRGLRNGRSFKMHIDASNGALLFYSERV